MTAARRASSARSADPGARCRFLREQSLVREQRPPAALLLLEVRFAHPRRAATFASQTGSLLRVRIRSPRALRPAGQAQCRPRPGSASASARPASDRSRLRPRPASQYCPSRVPSPSAWAAPAEGRPPMPSRSQIAFRRRPRVVLQVRFGPTPESSHGSALPAQALPAAWIPSDSRALNLIPNRSSVYLWDAGVVFDVQANKLVMASSGSGSGCCSAQSAASDASLSHSA
jgi:hypothetical protein